MTADLVVTIDCADADRMADFWASALGYERSGGIAQYRAIRPVDDSPVRGPKLLFQEVPEPKTVKNRIHLDIDLSPEVRIEDEVTRLVGLGATAGDLVEEFGGRWQLMADPEGNEFCIVEPPGGSS